MTIHAADPVTTRSIDTTKVSRHTTAVDPYEKFNRQAYRFTVEMDRVLVKPIAQVYIGITPPLARQGITHFFSNLHEVANITNSTLQGHFYWTVNSVWRLIINSTLGIGGLVDVASKMGLKPHDTSFAMTLAIWRVKPGPYLFLPFFGPTTVINAPGAFIDFMIEPPWFIGPQSPGTTIGLLALHGIDYRANLLPSENLVSQLSIDPYIFIRDAYLQKQRQQLQENNKLPGSKNADGSTDADDEIYTDN